MIEELSHQQILRYSRHLLMPEQIGAVGAHDHVDVRGAPRDLVGL